MIHFEGITQHKALAKKIKNHICVFYPMGIMGEKNEKETRHFFFYEMLTPLAKKKIPCKT
jgi:hypothetical protein